MDTRFIRVDEVAEELDVSKPYAYKLMSRWLLLLHAQSIITIGGLLKTCK